MFVSRSTKPRRLYRRLAASREGRDVRSTVTAPAAAARRKASRFSASPTPLPRADSSTTTSSIHARTPVGIRNNASVSEPTMVPSSPRATRSAVAGDATIADSWAGVGAGAERDSWGIKRANAATSSSVTAATSSTLTPPNSLLSVGDGNRRRRADVAGAGPDDAVVGRLLENIGAPSDHAARGERRREQVAGQTGLVHHDPGVELDVG